MSWRSKKQTIVAQSTVEVEYIAISFAVRKALWTQKLMAEIGKHETVIFVGEDNQRAPCISRDKMENEHSNGSRHYDESSKSPETLDVF